MVKYEKLTCSILGLQGTFPVTYLAGIEGTDVYNEVVMFETDQAIYLWKELQFRTILRSLTEISKETFESVCRNYKRMEGACSEKSRYRKMYFDAVVGGGDYFPLVIDKNTKILLQTNNMFRQTIEKMLAEQ